MRRQNDRSGFTLLELLVVLAILALLLGLTASAVQRVRQSAARASCLDHVRQLALALSHYQGSHGHFPSGIRVGGKEPMEYMGWPARILPYVEQETVWQQAVSAYRQQPNPWYIQPHPIATVIPLFVCPADGRLGQPVVTRKQFLVAHTSYLGVTGIRSYREDGILFRNSMIRPGDITDGLSHTLLLGERPPSGDFWYGWWYAGYGTDGSGTGDMLLGVRQGNTGSDPYAAGCSGLGAFRQGRVDNICDAYHFWSLHSGGGHFVFADGSARFLSYSADPQMPSLATRAGGEVIEDF